MNLIVDFTPTGMIPTKEMTPHVPTQPNEIIDQVLEADSLKLITKVHIHARDLYGKPTYKSYIYQDIINGIRKHSDLVVCVSTSGRTYKSFIERSQCLDVLPDMASLTLSSLNFNKEAVENSPQMIYDLAHTMQGLGIKPELEVFDTGMINYAKYLIKKGLLRPPYYFNFLFGNIACAQFDTDLLEYMLDTTPRPSFVSLAGIGSFQYKVNLYAIRHDLGVRVGLEDNIWYDAGRTKLASNLDLLKRIKDKADHAGREIMSPKEFRELVL